jgi:hypothetical protein
MLKVVEGSGMKGAIMEMLNEFAKWDTCPIELKIPRDKFIALQIELIGEKSYGFLSGVPMETFWIEMHGPAGKCRIVPG